MKDRGLPIAGILIALATGGVLIATGVSPLLAIGAIAIWIATFWLTLPPPSSELIPSQHESVRLTRTGMRDMVENFGLPLLMLDGERIIIANAAAREALGAHILGQDARVAFRHPVAVELLSRQGGGRETISGLIGPRTIWHMSRHFIDERYSMVELVNRTAEADISRAHTDFVANASHELRTPLASIIGYMETLVDGGGTVEPALATRFHATVLREAKRLQGLVEDLMSLSRVEAEKHDRPRDTVNLSRLVRQAALDGAGPERQDRVMFDLRDDDLSVFGDYRQLEQVVRNLVDNALKYGATSEPVTVELSRDKRDMAVLAVRDRGEGIAPEHLPHLTRRFYRTDPGRSRASGGTGLGLAIVKHITERHRGQLDITSRAGDGTSVTVRIPLAADTTKPDHAA